MIFFVFFWIFEDQSAAENVIVVIKKINAYTTFKMEVHVYLKSWNEKNIRVPLVGNNIA